MQPRLSIEHLTKHYHAQRALDDLSITVRRGVIFGLLGRNGAGKTTTFSCALGLRRPTSGRILFNGLPLCAEARNDLAYVPEAPELYEWMTAQQHIEFLRRVYARFDRKRACELAEMFEIPMNRRVRLLSKGQRTAVALMLAFARGCDLFFLDEPSSGLDIAQQQRLLELLLRSASDGATILLSSHHIGHVERTSEELAILDRGRVVVQGNTDEIRERHRIVEAIVRGDVIRRRVAEDADAVATALARDGAIDVRIVHQTLEDIFLEVTGAA